jgi:hypothetical protein
MRIKRGSLQRLNLCVWYISLYKKVDGVFCSIPTLLGGNVDFAWFSPSHKP